jgi:hypothetical protein
MKKKKSFEKKEKKWFKKKSREKNTNKEDVKCI